MKILRKKNIHCERVWFKAESEKSGVFVHRQRQTNCE